MVEDWLKNDDRCVLPLGCTEQHAYLSLATDSILAERLSLEAAEPLGVPVFPVIAYGVTPMFTAYPGTVSLSMKTYMALLDDILTGLVQQGFSKILIVNGHGGNTPARTFVAEFVAKTAGVTIVWHDWWNSASVSQVVQSIDPVASHASWMENFTFTRISGAPTPVGSKPLFDFAKHRTSHPSMVRADLEDGNCGGVYEKDDEAMARIWNAGVRETRTLLMNL